MKAFFMRVFFLSISSLLISISANAISGYQNNNGTCMSTDGNRICHKEGAGSPQPHCDVWVQGGSHCGRNGINGKQNGILQEVYKEESSIINDSKTDNRKTISSKPVESIR